MGKQQKVKNIEEKVKIMTKKYAIKSPKKRSTVEAKYKMKRPNKMSVKERYQRKKRGVVYLGHIPHGFYEAQMRDYFAQFGTVLRLRMSRSRKTAKSKGYAFIEFEDSEVAKIAAQSMNNYLMFERLLKCEYIPPERVHRDTFKNYGQIMIPFKGQLADKRRLNSHKSSKKLEELKKRGLGLLNKFTDKLSKIGITFDSNLVIKTEDQVKSNEKPYEMEVDSSDDEVSFKTPPNAVRIRLKSKANLGKAK